MIYFVQSPDDPLGLVKIGHAKRSAEERIKDLQIGSPVRLGLLLVIDGDRDMETFLHRQFAAGRVHGEWFLPSPELREFIEMAAAPDVPRIADEVLADLKRLADVADALGVSVDEARARIVELKAA